ncbi:MAG: hypothetical protein V3U24_03965 [Candidatus Neomarinimicrobiota bacterium]
MILFPIIGSLLILFGVLLMASPRIILGIERTADRIYVVDQKILRHRYVFGVLLVLSALYMIYVYFIM